MAGKKQKLLFIVNPKSGKGSIKNHLMDIIDIFIKNDRKVTVHITQREMDACQVTGKQAKKYDLIVCSGGDGTLDEVITGMMARKPEERCPVGYIPAGSTNDFAGSLGLPRNMKEAAGYIMQSQPCACDIGGFNENYFVYIAAFGAFTDVSYQTRQEVKNVLGHLAYVLEGAKRLFNLKSYHMKISTGEEQMEDDFIFGMVTNSRSVGGFKNITGKNVQLDDGVFEVTLIRMPKNPIELQEILGAILLQEMDHKLICTRKASRVVFESEEEIPWTLDGEFGGNHREVVVRNHKHAISIMAKKDNRSTCWSCREEQETETLPAEELHVDKEMMAQPGETCTE